MASCHQEANSAAVRWLNILYGSDCVPAAAAAAAAANANVFCAAAAFSANPLRIESLIRLLLAVAEVVVDVGLLHSMLLTEKG